jgi:hypothetical protein
MLVLHREIDAGYSETYVIPKNKPIGELPPVGESRIVGVSNSALW